MRKAQKVGPLPFKIVLLLLTFLRILVPVGAKEFTYIHNEGDQFRFLSTVNQEAGWQGDPLTKLQIINRISFTVSAVDGQGVGQLRGEMQSSEQVAGQESALWQKGYDVAFSREPLGKIQVSPALFVPAVRHAPAFPARSVNIGERWIHPGEEVLDLRQLLNLQRPYIIPFNGEYTYKGTVEKEGKTYHHIHLKYKWTTTIPDAFLMPKRRAGEVPVKAIRGEFDQDIYWDDELHQPAWYEEHYHYWLTMEDNSVYIMRGDANAYLIDAKPMDKEDITKTLNDEIERLGLENVRVQQDDDGITLIMESIQFNPNSAFLVDSEIAKLKEIANLLNAYPDRDLEITGHTAKSISESAAQRLSEQRALSVANFLIQEGVRPKEQIITRGEGSRRPIASNDNAEGMERNRRVEIKIREN